MDRNRERTALTALCALAIVFAAALFPTTGLGTYPSGPGDGAFVGSPGDHDGPSEADDPIDSPSEGERDANDPPAASRPSKPTTESSAPSDNGSNGTTTDDEAVAGGAGDRDGVIAGVTVALVLVGALFVANGFGTGTLAVGGDGRIPVTVRGTPLDELLARVPIRTMGLVVGLSASVPRLVDDVGTLLAELGRGLSVATVGLGSAVVGTASVFARGVGGAFAATGYVLGGLFSAGNPFSRPRLPNPSRRRGRDNSAKPSAATGGEPSEDDGPASVEEAWRAMVGMIRAGRRETRTPEELARAAIERGFPTEPVRRLTRAFREVRYGEFPPSAERTRTALTAFERIEQFRKGDGA